MCWNKIKQWFIRKPRQILAIDDNPIDQRVLIEAIRQTGCLPLVATTGAEGLAMARAHRPDVIILDVYLPRKEGFDIGRQIRGDALLKDVSLMYFTVASSPESIIEGLKHGDLYVSKPFQLDDLVKAIRAMLARRQERVGMMPTH